MQQWLFVLRPGAPVAGCGEAPWSGLLATAVALCRGLPEPPRTCCCHKARGPVAAAPWERWVLLAA